MASAATSARDAWIASVVDDEGRRRQLRETAYCLEDFKQARLESLAHTLDLRSWPPLARMRFIDAWQRLKDGSAVDPVTAVVPAPAPETPFAGDEAPTPLPVEPAPPRAPAPLPAPAVVSPEGPPQPVASPTIATAWTCTACFSTNDDEDSACVVCQGPRPGVAAPSRDGNLEALMADYVYGFGNAPVAPAPAVAPPPLHGPTSPRDPDRRLERRPERPNAPPPPPRPACTACLQIQNRGKAKKAHTCGNQRNRTPGYKWTEEQDLAILDVVRSGVGVMRRLDEGIVYAKTANAAFGFEVTDSQFGRRWRVLKATEAGRTALVEGLVAADRRDAARAAAARRRATDATTAPRFKPSTETPANLSLPTDTFQQQLAETLASLPSPPSTPPGARAPRPTSQGTPSSVEAARHAEPPATWWTGADALSGKVYYYNTMTGAASPTWPPQI